MIGEVFSAAKLLITTVGKGGGRCVVEASKRGGARGGTKLFGRGVPISNVANSEVVELIDQELVVILMHSEADSVINAIIAAAFQKPECMTGTALLVDVPKTLVRDQHKADQNSGVAQIIEGEPMKSGFTMITSIISHGQAEEIMDIARKAGARGGTILNARGTGTEDDVKFFGISLAPEKEMLIIISESAYAEAILNTLSSQQVFSEPGGGIIFTTNVEQLITLGSQ